MRKFNDYEKTQSYATTEKLPVGGYVLRIEAVRYEEGKNGNSDRIQLRFDVAEGEQKDFFRKNYDSQTSEDKKWKGTMSIYVPKDDGSEQDSWTKRRFKTIMEAFEASNDRYTWNWDENSLKGKFIGGVFGEINTVIDDKQITYVGFRYSTTVDNIRNRNYKIPEPQTKNGATANTVQKNDGFMSIPAGSEEEIPF